MRALWHAMCTVHETTVCDVSAEGWGCVSVCIPCVCVCVRDCVGVTVRLYDLYCACVCGRSVHTHDSGARTIEYEL